jgi:hypothetical protein
LYIRKYLFGIFIFFFWLKWIFQLTKHSLIVYYACDIKSDLFAWRNPYHHRRRRYAICSHPLLLLNE